MDEMKVERIWVTKGYGIGKWRANNHGSKELKFPIPRIGKWKEMWWERMHGNGKTVRRLLYGGSEGMCISKAYINIFFMCL